MGSFHLGLEPFGLCALPFRPAMGMLYSLSAAALSHHSFSQAVFSIKGVRADDLGVLPGMILS